MKYATKRSLTPNKATELINKITSYADSTIELTNHCRERLLEKNFVFQDLLLVLSNGNVKSPAEYDKKHQNYKYKVEGSTIDVDKAIAILNILDSRTLRVITIY